jgi:hypothetical protein
MSFSAEDRAALLAVKGIGATVLARLEQMGFSSLVQLSEAKSIDIVKNAAAMTGSSCWKNSPQARTSIEAAINMAKGKIIKS